MTFAQDALLLIGHGSSRYDDAGRVLQEHAAALRTERHFAEIAVGLLRGLPDVRDALAELTARIVHVVPFFMEDGHFVRVAVPVALARQPPREGQTLRACPPVGTHNRLAALLCARVLRHCPEPDRCTVVLVGHGSGRAPGRTTALHRHQARLDATGRFAQVRLAFLEEPPLIADVLASLRRSPAVLVGFFAGEGGHVRDDLPGLIARERARRGPDDSPLLDLGTISDDPAMRDIILDRVRSGSGDDAVMTW